VYLKQKSLFQDFITVRGCPVILKNYNYKILAKEQKQTNTHHNILSAILALLVIRNGISIASFSRPQLIGNFVAITIAESRELLLLQSTINNSHQLL